MNPTQLIVERLRRGPRTAAELAAVTDVSTSTVTRAIANIPEAIQMGMARATRYGLAASIRGLPAGAHPVYRVDRMGTVGHIGNLTAIVGGDFWYENLEAPDRSRSFESLPWFLQDMRPQGFLGRATVRHFASQGWPADLAVWSESDVLGSILHSAAHEHIGNLLIGERARLAFDISQRPLHTGLPFNEAERIQRYRGMVDKMGDDAVAGTSVNGEQPKFCAQISRVDSDRDRHVLVKFSAPIETEQGQRWSDLLLMEELCLRSIRNEFGIPSANAVWLTDGQRAYLEIDRFDRTDQGGRRGVVSFTSLDSEFVGLGENWTNVATALTADGQLENGSVERIRFLEFFAELTANNDRHLGNLSVHFDGTRPMTLTPIYDFLPMRYAPTTLGMSSTPLSAHDLGRALASDLTLDLQQQAAAAAIRFWNTCGEHPNISQRMRGICLQNAVVIGGLQLGQHQANAAAAAPGPFDLR